MLLHAALAFILIDVKVSSMIKRNIRLQQWTKCVKQKVIVRGRQCGRKEKTTQQRMRCEMHDWQDDFAGSNVSPAAARVGIQS